MSELGEIRLHAADLRIGDTLDGIECPFCRVGHERKLSITRVDGGLLYNCYRAKCAESGFIPDAGSWERKTAPDKPVHRPYLGKLYPLSDADEEAFLFNWGIVPTGAGVSESGHYAFPMFSPRGERRGVVLRNPVWSGRWMPRPAVLGSAKSLNYKDRGDDPNISWSARIGGGPRHVVLVEDYISACKVSEAGYIGVALNGVHLTYEAVREIRTIDPVSVGIWLDPGAETKAYNIPNKWGLTFNFTYVIIKDIDPKDFTVPEIKEILDAVRW